MKKKQPVSKVTLVVVQLYVFNWWKNTRVIAETGIDVHHTSAINHEFSSKQRFLLPLYIFHDVSSVWGTSAKTC